MQREIFKTLKLDAALRWTKEVITLVNNPEFLKQEIEKIQIVNYKGTLPSNFLRCIKVDVLKNNIRVSTITSSNPFLKDNSYFNKSIKDTYSYQLLGNYIIMDFEEGEIQMAYTSLPIDEDGYIMIPDNVALVQAVMCYIKYKHLEILNDIGQVDFCKVEKEEQNYLWYVGKAQSEQFMDNFDKLESVKNIVGQLYPNRNQHEIDYLNVGRKEIRY